jgi:S-disulfanyl-L-cysteine oxidoreductase SoxD
MCSWRSALAAVLLGSAMALAAAQGMPYPGIGRAATPAELAAWDTDVRADFKGLPKGAGSVAQGQVLWENQCASCHGMFGESNQVFQPIVGGTTEHDVKSGRSARLTDASFPGRTTLMKLPTLSTLWDYVHRAMPWNAPKSLSPDQVYAVVAYMLNLGGVVPDDFVLSDATIAQAQARLPNRNGMTKAHALWPGAEFTTKAVPDVRATRCMRNCAGVPHIASTIPEHARDAHGNLAEQNRGVGAQRGADTSRTPVAAATTNGTSGATGAWALAGKHGCTACHGIEGSRVGPGFRDVGRKHGARGDAVAYLNDKIRSGGAGTWGNVPMPPQSLPEADALALARWIAHGAAQ